MAGLVNEMRRTDNFGNGPQKEANRAAQANKQCYETFVGPPSELAHVIQMCAENAGWRASADINVSGYSLSGIHNSEVYAEGGYPFAGFAILGGRYRTCSGGVSFLRQDRPFLHQGQEVHPAPWHALRNGISNLKVLNLKGPPSILTETRLGHRFFPRALVFSPEHTAGQTACPEELPARARKVCGEVMDAAPARCPGAGCKSSAFSTGTQISIRH